MVRRSCHVHRDSTWSFVVSSLPLLVLLARAGHAVRPAVEQLEVAGASSTGESLASIGANWSIFGWGAKKNAAEEKLDELSPAAAELDRKEQRLGLSKDTAAKQVEPTGEASSAIVSVDSEVGKDQQLPPKDQSEATPMEAKPAQEEEAEADSRTSQGVDIYSDAAKQGDAAIDASGDVRSVGMDVLKKSAKTVRRNLNQYGESVLDVKKAIVSSNQAAVRWNKQTLESFKDGDPARVQPLAATKAKLGVDEAKLTRFKKLVGNETAH